VTMLGAGPGASSSVLGSNIDFYFCSFSPHTVLSNWYVPSYKVSGLWKWWLIYTLCRSYCLRWPQNLTICLYWV